MAEERLEGLVKDGEYFNKDEFWKVFSSLDNSIIKVLRTKLSVNERECMLRVLEYGYLAGRVTERCFNSSLEHEWRGCSALGMYSAVLTKLETGKWPYELMQEQLKEYEAREKAK